MKCPECGEELDDEDQFYECPFCDEDTGEGIWECPNCGTYVDWDGTEWECPECDNLGKPEHHVEFIERESSHCPECGCELDDDDYCPYCGWPNNQGWIGENY